MAKKGQVSVIFDKSKKADVIVASNGAITFTKDTVVRIEGDPEKPCKATRIILNKMQAGSAD